VPGRDNPADVASRGIALSELEAHPLWWTEPPWLGQDRTSWPEEHLDLPEGQQLEARSAALGATQLVQEKPEILQRFSSLHRLVRVTAWCRRWRRITRDKPAFTLAERLSLRAEEIDEALSV